ncbi:MAG: hypothetical protein R3B49_03735 [Phycisphaerales bacterium]
MLIEWGARRGAVGGGAIVVRFSTAGVWRGRGRPGPLAGRQELVVAVGLTGFAAVAAGIERFLDLGVLPLGEGLAVVVLVVFADAVLCDIADAESDLDAGTRTIPAVFGTRRVGCRAALGGRGAGRWRGRRASSVGVDGADRGHDAGVDVPPDQGRARSGGRAPRGGGGGRVGGVGW